MFSLLLAATVSTAGEPAQVVMSPEAAAQVAQEAEEAHEELMGELQAMSEDVRTIDIELLKKAIQAHEEAQEVIVSMEESEITDDSGEVILAPVPVMGPSVAP
tara:strand:+ start:460 stop:768 length:309 start_codon:yes stop_codon:yes gene_type:complete